MHSPLKKYKGERRESILAQRGEACKYTKVLTRLVGSRGMRVFLHDSTGVLSRPTRSGAELEMKTYNLKIFNLQAKIPFTNSKYCDQVELLIVFE